MSCRACCQSQCWLHERAGNPAPTLAVPAEQSPATSSAITCESGSDDLPAVHQAGSGLPGPSQGESPLPERKGLCLASLAHVCDWQSDLFVSSCHNLSCNSPQCAVTLVYLLVFTDKWTCCSTALLWTPLQGMLRPRQLQRKPSSCMHRLAVQQLHCCQQQRWCHVVLAASLNAGFMDVQATRHPHWLSLLSKPQASLPAAASPSSQGLMTCQLCISPKLRLAVVFQAPARVSHPCESHVCSWQPGLCMLLARFVMSQPACAMTLV